MAAEEGGTVICPRPKCGGSISTRYDAFDPPREVCSSCGREPALVLVKRMEGSEYDWKVTPWSKRTCGNCGRALLARTTLCPNCHARVFQAPR